MDFAHFTKVQLVKKVRWLGYAVQSLKNKLNVISVFRPSPCKTSSLKGYQCLKLSWAVFYSFLIPWFVNFLLHVFFSMTG